MAKQCATCQHWAGNETSYAAACNCTEVFFTRTQFDFGCPAWVERKPIAKSNPSRSANHVDVALVIHGFPIVIDDRIPDDMFVVVHTLLKEDV